ncbi:HXXEE domain-containing protein [Ureibacillus sp. Re31]|uniref:HXXEE domain-containing protein n=1 Tax=Ureibacillus galli TaxID=2762222 RepID=A0ABR8X760_9BACL|nr:HXXEE domain-containing protein [Ureibacillus galli]MBD8025157.1 HXXEE domain-containing protein [Ureibacillus galli]
MEELVILFLFAITLHNLEEALWLPAWSQQVSKFHKPVGKDEFHFAVIIITSLAYLITFLFLLYPNLNLIKYMLIGFLGSMVVNAIFPHLLATILLRRYAPGVVTGILLNIPINSMIIVRFIQENEITLTGLFISTIIVGIVLLSLIPILFKVGKRLLNKIDE